MNTFNELDELLRLERYRSSLIRFETLGTIETREAAYPVKAIVIGSDDRSLPTLGFFGGVHGLEKVGSQILLAFFHSFFYQLTWDRDLVKSLDGYRIVSIPIINPGGMARSTRCNPCNVDLMRNAPVEADPEHTLPLISGHRVSPQLPWYRGEAGKGLEKEAQILVDFVKREMFEAQMALSLDVHSGFGVRDQIWYPYAKTKAEFPRKAAALKLKALLDTTFPHHIYKYECQSDNYITSGDLWDYLFDGHHEQEKDRVFLPLTLELGSWNWIRKNPVQFFSKAGLFHPMKHHRHSRIMRRHLILLNFLLRAVRNHSAWLEA